MQHKRSSGILLHITSLPGNHGIGDLGSEAFKFIDLLKINNIKVWQILPLGPIGPGNSPYQAYSGYAGEPLLISLDDLVKWGILQNKDIASPPQFSKHEVDFEAVSDWKNRLLKKAWLNFQQNANDAFSQEYQNFKQEHGWWLNDYALYTACKKEFDGKGWNLWDEQLARRDSETLEYYKEKLKPDYELEQFKQFLFMRQWFRLKNYANSKSIELFGDLPLYVSHDSSDVWGNQELFLLDKKGEPMLVGGVPPDYFSEDGQLWGNPVFNWEALKRNEYHWWIARIYFNLHLFNLVRIDHFRGLESFWAIPANAETAKIGTWMPAHGEAILTILKERLGELPIIAEDLGTITPEVEKLRTQFDLPGMKVLQFGYIDDPKGVHLPHNWDANNVVYTGTHDNNTTQGWWNSLTVKEKQNTRSYLGKRKNDIVDKMVETAMASVANLAIIPLQDVLHLGENNRMNVPGTATGNWRWRVETNELRASKFKRLAEWIEIYNRK